MNKEDKASLSGIFSCAHLKLSKRLTSVTLTC